MSLIAHIPVSALRVACAGLLVVAAVALAGCSKADDAKKAAESIVPAAEAATPPPEAPPPPPTAAAAAWTPSALDELLAPVALYPDPILAQVLSASTNAQEVLDAGNWLLDHHTLQGDELTKAASDAGFSPSVQALVHFPTVVDMMCRELDWTRQLGDAFSADQSAVLASVQRLRAQAAAVGNLKTSPEMKVEKTVEQDKPVIAIQPANPQVIYVPQYNPVQAYAPPPVATATTTGISTQDAIVGGVLLFTAGILVADLFDDHHGHYHCYPNWGYGGVYYGPHPYYPHRTFIYAPTYVGYRPAPYYRPPAAYPYRYNNYSNYGRANVNPNATNNTYFNRFDKNQNRLPTYQSRPPIASPMAANRTDYRGQTTYNGANQPRPTTAPYASRPTTGAPATTGTVQSARGGQPVPSGTYQGARAAQAGAPNAAQRNLPSSATRQGPRPATREYQRPYAGADRGYPRTSGSRPDVTPTTQQRGGSISGAGVNQGAMDRAASERGRSSMQGAPRPSAGQQQRAASSQKSAEKPAQSSQSRARQQQQQ